MIAFFDCFVEQKPTQAELIRQKANEMLIEVGKLLNLSVKLVEIKIPFSENYKVTNEIILEVYNKGHENYAWLRTCNGHFYYIEFSNKKVLCKTKNPTPKQLARFVNKTINS